MLHEIGMGERKGTSKTFCAAYSCCVGMYWKTPAPLKTCVDCVINQSNATRKPSNAKSVSSGIMSSACPLLQSRMRNFSNDSKLVWICNICAFPNFSTTFLLNNILDITDDNSFASLNSNHSPIGSPLYASSPTKQQLQPK